MTTDQMLEKLGSDATEKMVHENFDGMTKAQILNSINEMFPHEDRNSNEKLSEAIYEFCS